jgi:hypothetical protein
MTRGRLDRLRPLSYFAASTCENATHPRCRCRCGGALHGARRGPVERLPPDDPHHAEPGAEDPQTSLLEALDTSHVLARLERGPFGELGGRPAPTIVAPPSSREIDEWIEELRELAEGGAR